MPKTGFLQKKWREHANFTVQMIFPKKRLVPFANFWVIFGDLYLG